MVALGWSEIWEGCSGPQKLSGPPGAHLALFLLLATGSHLFLWALLAAPTFRMGAQFWSTGVKVVFTASCNPWLVNQRQAGEPSINAIGQILPEC